MKNYIVITILQVLAQLQNHSITQIIIWMNLRTRLFKFFFKHIMHI